MHGKLLEFAKLYGYEENDMQTGYATQPKTSNLDINHPYENEGQRLMQALANHGHEWWVLNEINNFKPEDVYVWEALFDLRSRIVAQIRQWEDDTGIFFGSNNRSVIRRIITEKLLARFGAIGALVDEPTFSNE